MSRKNRDDRVTVRKPEPTPRPRMCARCGRREATDGYAWYDQCRIETRDAHLRNAARGVFPEEPF